jgi:tetratricopeptide (TPR) repeat protein
MALITYYHQSIFKTSTTTALTKGVKGLAFKSFPFLTLLMLVPAIYITNTTYKSLKAQMLILQDFNSNKYNLPLNQIETFIPPLPNITVTTIPMEAIKARYYFHYKKYDKALALAESAKEANPYLRYPEILQSQVYEAQGNREAAWEMAKLAFEQLPRNPLHASKFINLSMQLGKREAIKAAFPLLTLHNEQNNWKNYLVAVSQLFPPGQEPFVSQAATAVTLFPGNQDMLNLQRLITLGTERINSAAQYSQEGLNFFNAQDYTKAAAAFEKAIKANPLDYAHYENAATSNYLMGNLEKAQEQIDKVINELNPLNGKCEYIKALIFIRMGDPVGACPLLATARDSGYSQATATFDQYCK